MRTSIARHRSAMGMAALALAGALLSVQPHISALIRTGDPAYFADSDGLLYHAWSRDALHRGAGHLVDAIHEPSGPLMHPSLLFLPPGWLAYGMGLGETGLGIVWRLLGGAGIALGLYCAIGPMVREPRLTLAAVALLLFSPGFLFGLPLRLEIDVLWAMLRGGDALFAGVPRILPHLRVVTPALALPFLLVHFGLALRARQTGSVRWAIAAAVSVGLLFYTYFYFWTVAVGALSVTLLLDRTGRRTWSTILVFGVIIGLPALIEGASIKAATSADWLLRTDKFVPIGHFEELLIPKQAIAIWLAMAAVVYGRRDLAYVWVFAGVALALLNHQIVTGLQIENFHWIDAVGVPMSLLLTAAALPWLSARRWGPTLLAALVLAQVAFGFTAREWEIRRSRETLVWAQRYADYTSDAIRVPAGAVTAGDPDYLMLAAALTDVRPLFNRLVEFSALTTDTELDERLVLNLYLLGTTRGEAEHLVNQPAGTLSREAAATRDPALAARQQTHRRDLIARIWEHPESAIRQYQVTAVVAPSSADADRRLSPLARCVQKGRRWSLWLVEGDL